MATTIVTRLRRLLTRPFSVSLLVVLCLSRALVPVVAEAEPAAPVLHAVMASTTQPGTIMVSGTGFTLGGLVFIAIHDQWGTTEHETRWVTASQSAYQPPQAVDQDESFSFDSGGNVGELFAIPLMETELPSDSHNPALGTVTSVPTTMGGVDCATSLMVRAYDRSSATWSNIVDVDLGC